MRVLLHIAAAILFGLLLTTPVFASSSDEACFTVKIGKVYGGIVRCESEYKYSRKATFRIEKMISGDAVYRDFVGNTFTVDIRFDKKATAKKIKTGAKLKLIYICEKRDGADGPYLREIWVAE